MITTTPNFGFTTIATGDTDYAGEFDTLITKIDSVIATVSGSQKAIVAGSNITVVSGTNQITISAAGGGGGSINAIVGDSFISVSSGTNTINLSADAIVGGTNVTVVSGTDRVTISAASGGGSVHAIVGGTNVFVTSGTNQIVISAEEPPAIIGTDGITVTSGSNTITLTGFRTEFVSASGSLQTQIDTNAVPTLTHRQVAYGDSGNELTSSSDLTFTGSGPTMGLGVRGDITATGTVAGTKASFGSYPGLVEEIDGQWTQPSTGILTLIRSAAYPFSIESFTAHTVSNSTTSSITREGIVITGLDNKILNTTEATYFPTSTANVAVGETLRLTSSGSTGAEDLSFTLKTVRL